MDLNQERADKANHQIKVKAEFDMLGEKQEYLPIFISRLVIPGIFLLVLDYFWPLENLTWMIAFIVSVFTISIITAEIQNKANRRIDLLNELLRVKNVDADK